MSRSHDPQPAPWGLGLVFAGAVAVALALVIGVFGYILVALHPLVAVLLGTVVTVGFAGPVGGWRNRVFLRWVALGVLVGSAAGWLAVLGMAIAGV